MLKCKHRWHPFTKSSPGHTTILKPDCLCRHLPCLPLPAFLTLIAWLNFCCSACLCFISSSLRRLLSSRTSLFSRCSCRLSSSSRSRSVFVLRSSSCTVDRRGQHTYSRAWTLSQLTHACSPNNHSNSNRASASNRCYDGGHILSDQAGHGCRAGCLHWQLLQGLTLVALFGHQLQLLLHLNVVLLHLEEVGYLCIRAGQSKPFVGKRRCERTELTWMLCTCINRPYRQVGKDSWLCQRLWQRANSPAPCTCPAHR